MKRRSRFRSVLLTIIAALILVLLGTNWVKRNAHYESSDRKFYGFFAMVRYALIDYPVETFANFSTDIATFWGERFENDTLRQNLEAAALWQEKVTALENEVKELKELNGLNSLYSEYTTIPGRVIERPFDSWNQIFTIDIGSEQGVAVNDGVVSPNGLIGKVISVNANSAQVALLLSNTDDTQVSVRIAIDASTSVQGIVRRYDFDNGLFEIRLMDSSKTISEGMNVSTLGLGGVYPSGLPFGKVVSVQPVADGVGVIALVKSSVDFNNLMYIKVVKLP